MPTPLGFSPADFPPTRPVQVWLDPATRRGWRWLRIGRPSFLTNISPFPRRSSSPVPPPVEPRQPGPLCPSRRQSLGPFLVPWAPGSPRCTGATPRQPAISGEAAGEDESGVTNPRGGGEIWPNICDTLPLSRIESGGAPNVAGVSRADRRRPFSCSASVWHRERLRSGQEVRQARQADRFFCGDHRRHAGLRRREAGGGSKCNRRR
jgi:hypothetical protein